ncbi:MAG: hypothetical protein ABDH23_05740 [Endomicrobiia bacterium]
MRIKKSEILKNEKISKDTYLLELKYSRKVFPSQFIMIDTFPNKFLLKPFSIANFENNKITIIYRVISDGTKWLSTLKPKSFLSYIGPFGNFKKIRNLKIQKNNKIFLIGGGSGIACLIFFYKYLTNFTEDVFTFYGEKDRSYIINLKKFKIRNLNYCTDNGTYGFKGTVLDLAKSKLSEIKPDFIFICGPKEMIKLSQIFLKNPDIKCFVLLEEYMCCGVGVCRSCVVKVKYDSTEFKYQTVCKDGPLFELDSLILD